MAEGSDYGGYDNDLVDGSLGGKYDCLVCHRVLREPELTDCCGKHICSSCLKKWKKTSGQCPHCRVPQFYAMLDKSKQREINELKIYCNNSNCLWEGELSKLDEHLRSSCPQRETKCRHCGDTYTSANSTHSETCPEYTINCPNECGASIKRKDTNQHKTTCPKEMVTCRLNGPNDKNDSATCGKRMMRSELSIHQKVCLFREFECIFCHKVSTYIAITGQTHTDIKQPKVPPEKGHYSDCPAYPLFCRNKCYTKEIRRADMEQHLKECPLEMIQCERWEEGCREIVRRKDMSSHMKAYKKQHREYVWSAYVQKKEAVNEAKAELNATKGELEKVKKEREAAKAESIQKDNELGRVRAELCKTNTELAAAKDEIEQHKEEGGWPDTGPWFHRLKHSNDKELVEKVEELQTTQRKLKEIEKELKETNQKSQKQAKVAEEELYKSKCELEAVKKALKKVNENYQKENKARREVDIQVSLLLGAVTNLQEANTRLAREAGEANNVVRQLHKTQTKLESVTKEKNTAESELRKTRSKLESVTEEKNAAESELCKTQSKLESVTEEKNTAESELRKTQSKLESVIYKREERY